MKNLRSYWLLALSVCLSCNVLFPAEPNPNDCRNNAGLCTAKGDICDQATGLCARTDGSCTSATMCMMPSATVCTNNQCVPCGTNEDCIFWSTSRNATPKRSFCVNIHEANLCTECRPGQDLIDCTDPNKPTCDSNNGVCRDCRADNECISGICRKPGDYPDDPPIQNLKFGQCVSIDDISYVNKDKAGCLSSGSASSPDVPFCQLDAAINAGKPYIKIAGNTNGKYQKINKDLQGRSFILVGEGRDTKPTLLDEVRVQNGALVLSNLQVLASNNMAAAVTCDGSGSSIYMVNSKIGNNGGRAVDAHLDCQHLTVDRSMIDCHNNPKYGLFIGGTDVAKTTYRILNSAVIQCGDIADTGELYGIYLNLKAEGTFMFNTVYLNSRGLNCSNGKLYTTNSIITGSTTGINMESNCGTPSYTVTGNVDFMPGSEPKLVDGSAKNDACCVDKAQPPTGSQMFPTDYYGTSRPQGNGYDIGYQELK